MKKWRESCQKIRDLYRYENSIGTRSRKYALLWSNMQTMKGATYAKPPKADISRRFRDKDSSARVAGIMLERCCNFTFEAENYDAVFCKVRDDFLLEARGVARVVYEPVMEEADLDDDTLDGADVQGPQAETLEIEREAQDAGEDGPSEVLTFERVKLEYVHPEDFVTNPARTWEEVEVVGFRSYLTREKLVRRFGDKLGNEIQLDASAESRAGREKSGDPDEAQGEEDRKATIWEIWDKASNAVLWVSPGYPDVLEEDKPYLKFEHFFPCPRPAYGTMTSDTLAPRADYVFYQDQAEEINALTARIASLQDSLKIVGFYPGGPKGEGVPEVERAVTPGVENKMIAVYGWDNFASKGGSKGVPVVFMPVQEVAEVLKACVELRKQLIDDVNQIYGIADIMRGDGDARETATAQTLKGNYGSLRIRERQQELARFCRDVTRLVAEVICNHFQPDTIMSMANMPLPTDAEVMQQQIEAAVQARLQAQQQMAAQQQQAPMLGHNGGPPMGAPPGAPPPPQSAPQPQGMAR